MCQYALHLLLRVPFLYYTLCNSLHLNFLLLISKSLSVVDIFALCSVCCRHVEDFTASASGEKEALLVSIISSICDLFYAAVLRCFNKTNFLKTNTKS